MSSRTVRSAAQSIWARLRPAAGRVADTGSSGWLARIFAGESGGGATLTAFPARRQAWLARPMMAYLLALWGASAALGEELDPFEDDLRARIARVNTGTLAFLPSPPERPVHHHHNELILDAQSLDHGWARLRQCHEHLDAVPRAEVVFRPDGIRGLALVSASGIDRAWVEGPSVQLAGVGNAARLCLDAESQVVSRNDDGSYSVRNGPFMRRFLDGYYPMRVTLAVHYPCDRLRLAEVSPAPQLGFSLSEGDCRVDLSAWFEGRLNTEIRFVPRDGS